MSNYTIITGASSGIGLAFARIMAQNGHNLILVARNQQALQDIKTELENRNNVSVEIFATDLSIANNCRALFDYTVNKGFAVEILINNAGFGSNGKFKDTDSETDATMINLNVLSLTYLTHLFLPNMIERHKGRILNVASIAAFFAGPYMATYYATKSYVLSLSVALSNELKGTGITVTALCPGPTSTNFADTAKISGTKLFNKRNPTPCDVANYGYKKMLKGKAIAIHGFKNKLQIFSSRLFPRTFFAHIVGMLQKTE